ncbi:MAG: VTT domain-containing protein, partial [Pseudomonadota bacterium]
RESIIAVAMGVLIGLAIVAIFFDTPFSMTVRDSAMTVGNRVGTFFSLNTVEAAGQTIRSWGFAGAIAVTLFYALGSMIAFPSSLMTFVSVLAFGYGAILVTGIGAFIGLTASFFLGRYFFQKHIGWFCSRYPVTRGIEKALMKNGFWLVFLMRQSPIIPFAAQNYMFGMLQTRPRDYLLGSGLGIIPGTIAKIYVFESARGAISGEFSGIQIALIGIGITATLIVMAWVGQYVRRELNAQMS